MTTPPEGAAGGASDEGVVDADFEEVDEKDDKAGKDEKKKK